MGNYIQRFIPRQIDYKSIDESTSAGYDISIEAGLKAKVKDPLWFLSRQWQFAEFEASNGGSPIWMEFETEDNEMDEIIYNDETTMQFDISVPLEVIIEGDSDKSIFDDQVNENDIIGKKLSKKPKAWRSERLEYSFKISESNEIDPLKKIILNANEYYGERLDWYSFTLDKSNIPVNTQKYGSMPRLVEFPGMPKVRFWEFEDYRIDIGNLVRPQINPLSMLLTEFVLLFSNDYFIFPIAQKVGTLRSIKNVRVTDVFGDKIEIHPHVNLKDEGFSLFSHNEGDSPIASSANFYFPNIISHSYTSEPLEEIIFYRDNVQERVWAVERKYWNKDKIINRADELNIDESERQRLKKEKSIDSSTFGLPQYIIKTPIPENWIPYEPQKMKDNHFKLRRCRTNSIFNNENPQYKTNILSESKFLFEEEIPSIPILLTQYIEMTYAKIGEEKKYIFWVGREKKRGEIREHLNLEFDVIKKE